jgi:hypothetical protein
MAAIELNEPQRLSVGVALTQMRELAAAVQRLGGPEDGLAHLEAAMSVLWQRTDAIAPKPPRNARSAAVTQMRVLAEELRPAQLKQYGHTLAPDTAAELNELLHVLITAIAALYEG